MLEARAKYMLRNQVVEEVMIANPILKAVHSGRDATAVERSDLARDQRDGDLTDTVVATYSLTSNKETTSVSR